MERSLDLHLRAKRAKKCLIWGSINIVLLAIILFDIANKCPYAASKWYYVEYAAATILAVTAVSYFLKYIYYMLSKEPVQGTKEQKNLLGFDDNGRTKCRVISYIKVVLCR